MKNLIFPPKSWLQPDAIVLEIHRIWYIIDMECLDMSERVYLINFMENDFLTTQLLQIYICLSFPTSDLF